MQTRTTLKSAASLSGIGLFSGTRAKLTLHPAATGTGIVFERSDLAGRPRIEGVIARVSADPAHTCIPKAITGRNTAIASEDGRASVATIEHVMSALAGMGVSDAVVEVDGPEVPIGDGSALPFVEMIRAAGQGSVQSHGPLARAFVVREEIEVRDERAGARIVARPRRGEGTRYSYRIDYGTAAAVSLRDETASWDARGFGSESSAEYEREVAPARTFCTEQEAVQMRAMGLFPHLTERDMLVIAADGRAVENSYRFLARPFEPARHKLLDLIGDVALAGFAIQGEIAAEKSGHALTQRLVREICGRAGKSG